MIGEKIVVSVAFIDVDGDLMLKTVGGDCVWIQRQGGVNHYRFNFEAIAQQEAVHKFYPGDKLTIEF